MTRVVKTFAIFAVIVSLALTTTACVTDGWGGKQTGGTIIGAGLGGLLGSQFGGGRGNLAMTALGVLGGAWLGNEIGRSLDNADRVAAGRAAHTAFEHGRAGETMSWRNPDSGHSGTYTPTRTYQAPSGGYCREFQTTVTVGGKLVDGYGTACRQPDGAWKIVQAQ